MVTVGLLVTMTAKAGKEPELVDFLLQQEMAKHKLPERLEVVKEFPLSPFGKVSKKDLAAEIAAKLKAEAGLH